MEVSSQLQVPATLLPETESWLNPTVCLSVSENWNVSFLCGESNSDFFVVQPVFYSVDLLRMGRDSSADIAARYGLDGPGIESRRRRDFPHPSRPKLVLTKPPIQWVLGAFAGVMQQERGFDHPSSTSAEVKERVELYLYSPSGPVRGWNVLTY